MIPQPSAINLTFSKIPWSGEVSDKALVPCYNFDTSNTGGHGKDLLVSMKTKENRYFVTN